MMVEQKVASEADILRLAYGRGSIGHLIASDADRVRVAAGGSPTMFREHVYVGGPPPRRIKRLQLAHESRARRCGVSWDMIDLRAVYARDGGNCGICGQPVSLETFTIDHIVPISRGGPHLFQNMQIAHHACNSLKGCK